MQLIKSTKNRFTEEKGLIKRIEDKIKKRSENHKKMLEAEVVISMSVRAINCLKQIEESRGKQA